MPRRRLSKGTHGSLIEGFQEAHHISRNCSKYNNMDISRNCRFNIFLDRGCTSAGCNRNLIN